MSNQRGKGGGSIRQRSPGSWRIVYNGPARSDGQRKQVTETVRGTKKMPKEYYGRGYLR